MMFGTYAGLVAVGIVGGVGASWMFEWEAQAEMVPWGLLAPGGTAAAVIVVGWLLLRREDTQRNADRAAFTAALDKVSTTLGDRMTMLHESMKDHDRRVAETLREVTADLEKGREEAVRGIEQTLSRVECAMRDLATDIREQKPKGGKS